MNPKQLGKNDVFFVKHISNLNPQAKIPLQGIEWTETLNEKGMKVKSEEIPFEAGVFPESHQSIKFYYSNSSGYTFDRNIIKDDELQSMVKSCGFTFIKGRDIGKVIEEANPRNPQDPFFGHPDLTLKLEDFSYAYDLTGNPKNKIIYAMLKTDPRFLVLEEGDTIPEILDIDPRVEFVVTRSSIKEEVEQQKGAQIMEVYIKLDKAGFNDLKIIGQIWGISTNEDTSEKTLKEQMAFRISGKSKVPGSSQTYAESFMELIKLKGEKLNTKYLIKMAVQKGLIRQSTIGFTYNNNPLGQSMDNVEAFLLKQDNSALKAAIQLACESASE